MEDGAIVLKRAHTDFGNFEEDVIAEILARVPAKSLIRFRCVSKAWRALISESYFIKMHLSHIDTESISNWKLLLSTDPPELIDYQALSNIASIEHHDDDDDDDDGPVIEAQYPVKYYMRFYVSGYVGSCNGLVCTLYNDHVDHLWNPFTGEIHSLPTSAWVHGNSMFYGFGYDSATDDCKIVVGGSRHIVGSNYGYNQDFEDTMIQVFSLKTGYWRTLEKLEFVRLKGKGCVVNGALHWVKQERFEGQQGTIFTKIMCFDLGEEKFREMELPWPHVEPDYYDVGVEAIRNCLVVYYEPRDGFDYRVWAMKEYGVNGSWAEIIRIPFQVLPEDYEARLQPLYIFENDEVLMTINGYFLRLYSQKDKTFRNVFRTHAVFGWEQTTTYVETLVSPLTGR